jgi:outer membrane protein OmpA-like peptidoglycan-associated protein
MENDQEGFSFALATSLSAPIGQFFDDIPGDDSDQTGSFLGSGMVTVQPRLIFEYYMQPFHVAAQVGYRWQEDTVFYDRTLGHELTFGGGVGVWVIPDLQIFAEVFGSNAFTTRIDQTPLEADLAARYRIGDFVLTAGGGTGILKAIGSPVARAFLGFAYEPAEGTTPEPPNPDRDGDGILNDDDGCPDDPEDFDDYQDADGCSDPDNDGDGVLDIYDACPLVPEDLDGFEDGDGCPDLDHDGDGIPEPIDQCPTDPEDFDGFEDENGCPDLDNDADGIPDDGDVCPDEAEDFDGFEDEDGCPEPDNDQDGIPDAIDQCPDQPETLNGLEDEDGCPDRGRALVEVDADQIRIRQQVNFANDDDRIIGRQSFEILDVVATVLRLNPRVRVEVQGHTDNRGDYDHNIDLSQRRAQSVCNYLIEKGVSADRLVPRGYGPDQPIEDNRTNRGRSANRRVEFHILGAGGQDAGQDMPAPTDVEPPPPSDEMSFD